MEVTEKLTEGKASEWKERSKRGRLEKRKLERYVKGKEPQESKMDIRERWCWENVAK